MLVGISINLDEKKVNKIITILHRNHAINDHREFTKISFNFISLGQKDIFLNIRKYFNYFTFL